MLLRQADEREEVLENVIASLKAELLSVTFAAEPGSSPKTYWTGEDGHMVARPTDLAPPSSRVVPGLPSVAADLPPEEARTRSESAFARKLMSDTRVEELRMALTPLVGIAEANEQGLLIENKPEWGDEHRPRPEECVLVKDRNGAALLTLADALYTQDLLRRIR